jgi:Fe-S-cluster containining protein
MHTYPHRAVPCGEFDILVPFVCRRCGNCCRNYDPIIELELLPEIARRLEETIDVVQRRLNADTLAHIDGRPTDCRFLHPARSECIIYEIRPAACRHFPPMAGGGAGAVDCPGYREYSTVLNAFAGLATRIRQGRFTAAGRRPPIPEHARRDIRQILNGATASEGYRRIFMAVNGIPDSGPLIPSA